MKSFVLATLVVSATAFVPGIGMQHRGITIVSPSQQRLPYYRSGPNGPIDYESSFDDLRREFTSSTEPSADQVKKVVDRTFRFFQTLNREAASSTTDRSRNEETLDKLQKWIERAVDLSGEFTKDFPEPEGPGPAAGWTRGDNGVADVPLSVGANTDATDIGVDNRGTAEDEFVVQLDVPGVEPADLDLRLDESLKIVTVLGQRGGRSFSRGVALDAKADIEHLSATLKNGVLTLRAPKVKPPANNLKRIPVVIADK